jgi:MtrB/PioB family decaheme-associated outer membrane protein
MNNKLMLSTAVLCFAVTGVASAQQTSAAPAAAPALTGIVDIGYRGSSVDGDKARWERYRDLRDGLTSRADVGKTTDRYVFRFRVANAGYHDQQYIADYNKYGKLKMTAMWNSTPLNYGYNTLTPWRDAGNNVWTLDPATRLLVQNKAPGVLGIGSTTAHFTQASIYRNIATVFPIQARRDVLSAAIKYRLTEELLLNLAFTSTKKSGNQPYGAAFSFNNGNEIPMSLDNRTNDVTAELEWSKATKGMLRVAWDGSWFNNAYQSLTWDNPLRATDYSNGKTPPNGPYDASAYSNGNGAAFGRLALPPDNSMSTFSALGLYKMPGHSTLNGQVALTTMKQNDKLIPWTTNTLIATPAVYAYFPGLATLRPTAEAEVKAMAATVNYATRPNKYFGFDMRYRFNDHKNTSEEFDASNNVRFDGVPEAVPGTETEHFNIRRNTFEAGVTFTGVKNTSVKVGYIFDDVKREGRAYSNMADYTFRLSVDSYGNQYVMLRGLYEHTKRIGDGFSEHHLEDGGAQPGLRFYDEADMDRDKGTAIVSVTPTQSMEISFSFAGGKDIYKGEGHYFGLLDNNNTSYNVMFDFYPKDGVSLGGNYGYDKFSSLQRSRNANPPSGVAGAYESWLDPNRDWSLDNDETVKNMGLYLDLMQAIKNTDIRFSYNYSDSDNAFIHSGPRIQALKTNTVATPADTAKPCAAGFTSCFEALPNVTNTWQQAKVDIKHMFRPKVGLGLGYWYEKLEISDFATLTLPDGTPRIDPLGSLTTGYGNRPYKGQTGLVRLIVVF